MMSQLMVIMEIPLKNNLNPPKKTIKKKENGLTDMTKNTTIGAITNGAMPLKKNTFKSCVKLNPKMNNVKIKLILMNLHKIKKTFLQTKIQMLMLACQIN